PLIGYGLLRLEPLGEPGDSFRILLTTMTTVVGLGLVTLHLSMQGTELQRTDARLRLLATATEQTGDLILITKADGGFEHANDAWCTTPPWRATSPTNCGCGINWCTVNACPQSASSSRGSLTRSITRYRRSSAASSSSSRNGKGTRIRCATCSSCGRKRRAPARLSATCSRSCVAARPIAPART